MTPPTRARTPVPVAATAAGVYASHCPSAWVCGAHQAETEGKRQVLEDLKKAAAPLKEEARTAATQPAI